jgi:flagellin-specific chaperone FliS
VDIINNIKRILNISSILSKKLIALYNFCLLINLVVLKLKS